MFKKNSPKKQNNASRITYWENVAHGIVQMAKNYSDLYFLISEIRRQFADKQKQERELKSKSKKAGFKEQQMAQFLVGHPAPEQEREQFLAQMESQGFDRASFENAQKATMPKSMLPAKEKPMFENTKIKGKFNGKK